MPSYPLEPPLRGRVSPRFGDSLRALFNTLVMSLAPAANIGALLFLQLSVFSILGMQIFGSTGDWEAHVLPRLRNSTLAEFGQIQQTKTANFENFYHV